MDTFYKRVRPRQLAPLTPQSTFTSETGSPDLLRIPEPMPVARAKRATLSLLEATAIRVKQGPMEQV